jgi:hypothetical protein
MLHTTTNSGLHDFAGDRVLARFERPGIRAAIFVVEALS